jgi:hypothetical protein
MTHRTLKQFIWSVPPVPFVNSDKRELMLPRYNTGTALVPLFIYLFATREDSFLLSHICRYLSSRQMKEFFVLVANERVWLINELVISSKFVGSGRLIVRRSYVCCELSWLKHYKIEHEIHIRCRPWYQWDYALSFLAVSAILSPLTVTSGNCVRQTD